MPHALIAGLALTFAHADANTMTLTVALTESASVSLQWADVTRTAPPAPHHVFEGLPVRPDQPTQYVLTAGRETIARRVGPAVWSTPSAVGSTVSVAIIGDGGPGMGLRGMLLGAMQADAPDLVIALGDPLGWTGAAEPTRRRVSFALTSRTPAVFVAGAQTNREMFPVDPQRAQFGLPAHVFHLRVGPTVIMVLDETLGFAAESPQAKFVAAVTGAHADVRWRVVVLPRGPFSSGPNGGHPTGRDLLALVDAHHVDLVVSANDHAYERLAHGSATVVMSGLSGANTAPRARVLDGSRGFISTPHWVRLRLGPRRGTVEAISAEGARLDEAALPDARPAPPSLDRYRVFAAFGLLAVGLFVVLVALVRPRSLGPSLFGQ